MNKLMTIFAHQDDETFSAGGVLAKYAEIGEAIAVSLTFDPDRKKEFQKAIDYFDSALEINPKSIPALGNKAFGYINLKKIDEALQILEDAAKLNPRNYTVIATKGTLFESKKE